MIHHGTISYCEIIFEIKVKKEEILYLKQIISLEENFPKEIKIVFDIRAQLRLVPTVRQSCRSDTMATKLRELILSISSQLESLTTNVKHAFWLMDQIE